MTIDINELRRLAEAATPHVGHACKYQDAHWLREGHVDFENADLFIASERPQEDAAFYAAANPATVIELLDRLEAAESDALEQARLNGMGASREAALMAKLEAAEKERDALRAKIDAMERQEPVAWMDRNGTLYNTVSHVRASDKPLYLAPGAQPAPIIPEGWLRAIDEALVVAHIGVANESDTYEQAKAKLDNLIGFHVDVATDPAVNGGNKLVPLEAAEKDIALKERVIDLLGAELNAVANERDTLCARIEAMEKQEPVYLFRRKGWEEFCTCSKEKYEEFYTNPRVFEVKKLYLAPGAQPAPSLASGDVSLINEGKTQPAPSVPDSLPVYADPFTYVIQHLNSNPYSLTKDECVTLIKELRALYNAGPEAKP